MNGFLADRVMQMLTCPTPPKKNQPSLPPVLSSPHVDREPKAARLVRHLCTPTAPNLKYTPSVIAHQRDGLEIPT